LTFWPSRALLGGLAAWTAAAALLVWFPALELPVLGALAALVGAAGWDAWLLQRRPPLVLDRGVPPRAFVGQPAQLELRLRSAAGARAEVLEELPRDVAPEEPRFGEVRVPPGEPVVLSYAVRPGHRGDRALGRPVGLERSPLGLLRRRVVGETAVLRVYPDTTRMLRPAGLDPKRALATLGARPARRRGDGTEFESLRDYAPGDDPRRLDWAASARRGRPVVRLTRHERNHVVLVALDASRLMGARVGERTKLDFAVDAALGLIYASLTSGDRVGLAVFDRELRVHLAPRARPSALGVFVDALRPIQPRLVEADHAGFVRALAKLQRQRALVVVLTDFVEAESERLAGPFAVLGRRHRVLLVAVRDPIFTRLDPAPGVEDAGASLHSRLVLDDLLHERESALAALRRRGVETLDLQPQAITAAVLNRYLAIRRGPEL
jgi:uncharacterized protein (DUF58 family)